MALLVAVLVFVGLYSGACLGMWGARRLKEHHLSHQTQEAVKLSVGMVAAMTSLILGLLTASVKSNFDDASRDVHQFATYLVTLDQALRLYGLEAEPARNQLAAYTRQTLKETWRLPMNDAQGAAELGSEVLLVRTGQAIRALQPHNPDQTELRSEAVERYKAITALRWTVLAERVIPVSPVFIFVLVVWLTLIFFSFGLFAPENRVSHITFFLCAVSLVAALFLIIEMSAPFGGLIAVPETPLRNALAHMMGDSVR